MSKINAIRLINLNYNNNAIRISDEVFHLNGESTLLSLRNGGGKSVLVQMVTAPFVHKRYRDAKDRPFESYFTTNKPTFILVEWALDQGAGYVLTGMMVRRSQEAESADSLEIVNFINEYRDKCATDIHHLPVVEKTRKEIVLKNFGACRQLFEGYKKDRSLHFTCYDMNNGAQSRQYFEKLKEYQIDYKEWETIIKKVNLKESGLSDLFADCRDEKGLVEKWFLEAVESKLNRDRSRMKEFQTILEKYVGQYKDNRSKIERRDTIRSFQTQSVTIEELASLYLQSTMQEKTWENRIGSFRRKLMELDDQAQEQVGLLEKDQEAVKEAILHVEYEQLSQEIHELLEKERYHTGSRDMIGMEREALEQECIRIEELLHLLACAGQQEAVDEEHQEYENIAQKLEVARKAGEDLEPERQKLGSTLRHYFTEQLSQKTIVLKQKEQQSRENQDRIRQEKEKRDQLQEELLQLSVREGGLKIRIAAYDEQESTFNRRYTANLGRNILGDYEPGELELYRKELEKQLEQCRREKLAGYKRLNQLKEEQKGLSRSLEDTREQIIHEESKHHETGKVLQELEEELKERRVIMKYLEVAEEQLFDREAILGAAGRKLTEAELMKRRLQKEEDELQKEYGRLTQGRVLELPEEFSGLLKELGLNCVFGMDYLNKNGNTSQQNQRLVREHPFLPYALILSQKELQKLAAHTAEVYTSFPIPIVLRESLEGAEQLAEGGVIRFPQVSFYVLFNENLLEEEKLTLLVKEKEKQIRQKQESIAVRDREYREYFARRERILAQKVSKEGYEAAQDKLQELKEAVKKLKGESKRLKEKLAETEAAIQDLTRKQEQEEKQQSFQERRLEDFDCLKEAYERCQKDVRQLQKLRKEKERLTERKKLLGELMEKLEEQIKSLETEKEGLRLETERLKEKLAVFAAYRMAAEEECFTLSKEEITRLEARYQAITAQMSAELQLLEEQTVSARKRLDKAVRKLQELQTRYALAEGAWKSITYSRKEESHQEVLLEDRRKKEKKLDRDWNEENRRCAVVAQQVKDRRDSMQKRFGREEPLPKEEIRIQDFQARIQKLHYQDKELQLQKAGWEEKIRSFEEHLAALEEFSHFEITKEVSWEQDFGEMSRRELGAFQGTLLRDYRGCLKERSLRRDALVKFLNQVVRREEFQDEFYRKPLEAMLELSEDAAQVLSQLKTTVQSYERLMEKLSVDISMVEKEKARIIELLEDYLREVHEHLGRIDHNSTITIRERPVKMLKLQLPDWEENAGMYQVRLNDYIDELTQKGIEIFEKNENAQEYFGSRLTTKNLYDQVVGIGNVQIRLYKVEEQREYPITWAEVAKNSGGEGFLSAFIILTSLLYYMRRDESDIFADRNEGKVLLMDNPFAQTNAAHLLKPLMDMAKKTNTQLICLSGLGGDSIYNRFDNIYVLNLIAASLRGGMQYLKANHTRGAEPETMIVSQVEVMEQQELIF